MSVTCRYATECALQGRSPRLGKAACRVFYLLYTHKRTAAQEVAAQVLLPYSLQLQSQVLRLGGARSSPPNPLPDDVEGKSGSVLGAAPLRPASYHMARRAPSHRHYPISPLLAGRGAGGEHTLMALGSYSARIRLLIGA